MVVKRLVLCHYAINCYPPTFNAPTLAALWRSSTNIPLSPAPGQSVFATLIEKVDFTFLNIPNRFTSVISRLSQLLPSRLLTTRGETRQHSDFSIEPFHDATRWLWLNYLSAQEQDCGSSVSLLLVWSSNCEHNDVTIVILSYMIGSGDREGEKVFIRHSSTNRHGASCVSTPAFVKLDLI
ncbi:hypothetical protein J6590_044030 [Homalodisca vitripennis]|nr:hypothetical protein J6590_044030 [Homalodisca vitripennis]